jgi:hypothetical protein
MLTYKQRLELLNDTSDTVWNSIDKPMRRLIFEMNRTGLITRFCCFGKLIYALVYQLNSKQYQMYHLIILVSAYKLT